MKDSKCHRCLENEIPDDSVGFHHYELEAMSNNGPVTLRYNVSAAYLYAKQHRTPCEVPADVAKNLIFVNLSETFCGAHVEHVDRTVPAIIGTCGGQVMLLDGTHRMFGRMKHNEPPIAYVLNETETAMFEM